MVGAGLMYAMHLAVSQRVLYEMPAPTVALYVLSSMTVVVWVAYVLHGPTAVPLTGLPPTLMLAGITVLSRLLMFLGVKQLGSIQTALLGVTEILVTVVLSIFVLGEQQPGRQWIGAALLITSLLLIIFEPGIGLTAFRKEERELADSRSALNNLRSHPPKTAAARSALRLGQHDGLIALVDDAADHHRSSDFCSAHHPIGSRRFHGQK
jgi:uncharacterized membrane protein